MIVGYKFTLMLSALVIVSDLQHDNQVTATNVTCGVPAIRPRTESTNIVGGTEAVPHSWPWQCRLFVPTDATRGQQCGCSVLTSEWVVTAAHCYNSSNPLFNTSTVTLGVHNWWQDDEPTQLTLSIVKFVVHPQYQKLKHGENDCDIMLLKLESPTAFNDSISPVCLLRENFPAGTMCYTTGWGVTKEKNAGVSAVLLQAKVPIISDSQCKKLLSGFTITDDMICAGYEEGGVDACQGDSGGPLVCQRASGVWILEGIVSFGEGCARASSPGVYTRVAQFWEWINGTIDDPAGLPTIDPSVNLPMNSLVIASSTRPPVATRPAATTVGSGTNMTKIPHICIIVGLCMFVLYMF